MKKVYSLHPNGVLLHPELDELNGHQTVIFDWKADVFYHVNPIGYEILKIVLANPQSSLESIVGHLCKVRNEPRWQLETQVREFIQQMVKLNIVMER